MAQDSKIPVDLPIFEGIPATSVPNVSACLGARMRDYKKGDIIIAQNQQLVETGYLYEGSANIVSNDYWGNRSILGTYLPGSVIAAEPFFDAVEQSQATVVAATDAKIVFFDLRSEVKIKPCCMARVNVIRENLMRIIIKMNTQLINKLEILSNRTTRDKLLAFLSDQAMRTGSNTFDIPYSRQELADALYVERSALSRVLSGLQEEGLVSYSRNHFELHS